jgi:predicted deacylase
MHLGTADADPGELDRGHLDVTDLPTGTAERLPVILAEGVDDGPTLWLTAAIHGDEHTGLAAAQDAMVASLPGRLQGTVVCLPNLNPAGLRRSSRASYYHDDDPNRTFPDPAGERHRPPKVQELIAERLFDRFSESADALLDLHTFGVGSVPFVIRDRVLYGEPESESESDPDRASGTPRAHRDEASARELAADLAGLVEATGLPVVNEYPAEEYVGRSLQRSTAGAALNGAGIPACTFELGSHSVVEESNRALGVAGVYGVMQHLEMIDEVPAGVDAAEEPYEPPVDFPVRRFEGPRTAAAGLLRHRIDAGDAVEAGDVVADVVTPTGAAVSTVAAEHDGYVLGRAGVTAYENDPVASMAVRDEADLVVPREDDERDADDENAA